MPDKVNILVSALKMMGLRMFGGGDCLSRCIGAAEGLLDWLCLWSLAGGLVWHSVVLMMCVGVCHPLHPGCRCSELSLVLVVTSG